MLTPILNRLLMPLTALLLCTLIGCIDITEEYNLNKDGSGDYAMTLGAGKLIELMESMAAGSETPSVNATSENLDSIFRKMALEYKNQKGLSNVLYTRVSDSEFKISMHYADVASLNNAQKELAGDNANADGKAVFSYHKGEFARKQDNNLYEKALTGGDDSGGEMMKGFFADMKYKIIYNLPSKLKKVDSKDAVVSKDKKQVVFETNFEKISKKEFSMSHKLKF